MNKYFGFYNEAAMSIIDLPKHCVITTGLSFHGIKRGYENVYKNEKVLLRIYYYVKLDWVAIPFYNDISQTLKDMLSTVRDKHITGLKSYFNQIEDIFSKTDDYISELKYFPDVGEDLPELDVDFKYETDDDDETYKESVVKCLKFCDVEDVVECLV